MHNILKSFREFVCFNQKQTIKYEYLISEHHKQLKEYYTNNKNNINKKELEDKYQKFIITSYDDLFSIYNLNKIYIDNIFKSLGKIKTPRITIKTIHGDSVLNIYRSTKKTNFNLSNINDNTGFSDILHNNKVVFFCNNLPLSFKDGKYNNPRLDNGKLKLYRDAKIDWKDCWINEDGDDLIEYYSSTLIVPMSIRSDESDLKNTEFYNHFFKEVIQNKDSRTIWAFLCFDSTEINYFDNGSENDFEEIGYIIADILSLYLMYFYNHISGSSTINEIEQLLKHGHN